MWAGWEPDTDCLVKHINMVQVVKDCGRWDFGLCFTNDRFVKVICRTELIERSTVCENLGWLGGKEATILTLRTRDNWTWQPNGGTVFPLKYFFSGNGVKM